MTKTFVLSFATAALCSLAISASPALGHEFDGETSSPTTTKTGADHSARFELGGMRRTRNDGLP